MDQNTNSARAPLSAESETELANASEGGRRESAAAAKAGKLTIAGTTFRDAFGRHVLLRGVNFGGDCKLPTAPDGRTHLPSDFSDHATVSFVGRPAPLDELDQHLRRLRGWGFNCLRLLTTWEAVEHEAPGVYDVAYLDYFAEVCRRAGEHGFYVFIDFHQDVWSRMSGGDGAPGWTFAAAGLDFTQFPAADAALVMQHAYDHKVGGLQSSYPLMSWGGNYSRPANGIMWTLFFAGRDFAPTAEVGGVNIQDFLQGHYLGAMRAVAERVAHLDNVIGFDTLNEPSTGYLGAAMDQSLARGQGARWSPIEGLAVASGMTRELPVLAFGKGVVGTETVNAAGASIWLPGRTDPFRAAGAWEIGDDGAPAASDPDYFRVRDSREVDVERDYMVPLFNRVADTIRSVRPDWLVFAEVDPFDASKGHGFPPDMPERSVNANHWYDVSALVTKRFDPARQLHVMTGKVREGAQAIEDGYIRDLAVLRRVGDELNGGAPTLIGECGIQYDMNDAEAYRRWKAGERSPDIWSAQTAALDLMYNAFDRLLLSSTQWNYTVSNRNDPMIGDGWNQEDLSIWSKDQMTDGGDGGRAVEGFCRPYVRAAQGTLISQRFERKSGAFEAVIEGGSKLTQPTEVYVPNVQYPDGYTIETEPRAAIVHRNDLVLIHAPDDGPMTIHVTRKAPRRERKA